MPIATTTTMECVCKTDLLCRHMTNRWLIIEKLLELASELTKPVLKEKITQLEQMIADLPVAADIQANDWRDRVVELWRKFYSIRFRPETISDKFSLPWRVEPLPNGTSLFTNRRLTFYSTQFESHNAEALLQTLVEEFKKLKKLNTEPEIDALDLKKLLATLAQATKRILVVSTEMSPALKSSIFSLAFAKLCDVQKTEFRNTFGVESHSLLDLIRYLKEELLQVLKSKHRLNQSVDTASEGNTSNSSPVESSSPLVSRSNSDSKSPHLSPLSCGYCHSFGHPIYSCVELKNQLCFSCFQFGHRSRSCKNQALFDY